MLSETKMKEKETPGDLPCDFQLTETNSARWLVVPRSTELDVLRIVRVTESWLGRFIEAFRDMIEIIQERRVGEKLCEGWLES